MLATSNLIDTYRKADALLAKGELQQAADICKRMLADNPDFAYGYHLMATLFRTTGNLEKALNFTGLAIRIDPGVASFYVQRGQLLFTLKYFDEAAEVFDKLLEMEPLSAHYMLLRADVYAKQEQYDEAIALLSSARKHAGDAEIADVDEHEGRCMLAMGEIKKAEKFFDRSIAAKPEATRSYIEKGKILLFEKRDHEAEVCFAKAINNDPHSWEALHGMAIVNERQGQTDSAIALAIQAVNADNAIFDSLMLLGNLLLRKQSWDGAEHIFRQALSVIPDSVYAWHGLATSLIPQKKLETIEGEFKQLLVSRPDNKALTFLCESVCGKVPTVSPEAYALSWFDDYASRYEFYLPSLGSYQASSLCELVRGLSQLADRKDCSFLDLGCGSGMAAEHMRDITNMSVAVDLSPRMLDMARLRSCYDEYYALDVGEFALGSDRVFDIIIAMDVLPYIGDLDQFFKVTRNLMGAGSVFAFTVEKVDKGMDFQLGQDGRYKHKASYVRSMIEEQGYELLVEEEMLLRFDGGQPVKGFSYVIKKATIH